MSKMCKSLSGAESDEMTGDIYTNVPVNFLTKFTLVGFCKNVKVVWL